MAVGAVGGRWRDLVGALGHRLPARVRTRPRSKERQGISRNGKEAAPLGKNVLSGGLGPGLASVTCSEPSPPAALLRSRPRHHLDPHLPDLREAAGGRPARRAVGRRTDAQQIANAREAFSLDQPLIVQYGRFAGADPLPNTFLPRTSTTRSRTTCRCARRSRRLPVSAILRMGAAVLWLLIGMPARDRLGRPTSLAERRWTMILAIVGVSLPCSGSASCHTWSGTSSTSPRRRDWRSTRACGGAR